MYSIKREITFSYGHRILGHQGKCARLHGHNGRIQIEIAASQLDKLGMVVDFYEVKQKLGAWIDQTLDHRMILCEKDPAVEALKKTGESLVVIAENPTAEVLAKWVFTQAKSMGFSVLKVTLWETENSAAVYSG